jgi:two-component system CheB/CheR fusion protein
MNEELHTVNAELKSKLDSIGAAHSDLENIIAATDIGTLFLDTKLRIRMFTPRVARIFNVTESDVGRAITDFTHRLNYDGLGGDVQQVMHDLAAVEREVESRDGRWHMMRLRPYRTIDNRIDGVVVTFVDVTEQRVAMARLRESEEQYRILFETMSEGFLFAEVVASETGAAVDVRLVGANPAALAMLKADITGRRKSQEALREARDAASRSSARLRCPRCSMSATKVHAEKRQSR